MSRSPAGRGGGWDSTARGTGEALAKSGLVGTASRNNMSGGGGGVVIANLVTNAKSSHGMLMVSSTSIVIRALTGEISQSFRDLTLEAGTIGDYAALVVTADSPITTMEDALTADRADPTAFAIGGGSVPGGMDNLVAAIVMQGAGEDPTAFNDIGYEAGGEAMAGLLSGEIEALSTGLSEATAAAEQGEIRILGVTAPARVPAFDAAPTFAEQGNDAEFVNWRGVFAAPGLPEATPKSYQDMVAALPGKPGTGEVPRADGPREHLPPRRRIRQFPRNAGNAVGRPGARVGLRGGGDDPALRRLSACAAPDRVHSGNHA